MGKSFTTVLTLTAWETEKLNYIKMGYAGTIKGGGDYCRIFL